MSDVQRRFNGDEAELEKWFEEQRIDAFNSELERQEAGYAWFTAWYEYLMREEDYTPDAAERQAHAYCVQGRKPPTLEADDENAAPDAVGAVSEVTAIAAEVEAIATAFTDEDDEIPF